MSFHLVAVGKLKAAEKELYDRYAKRLGKTLNLTELPDSQASKVGEKLKSGVALVALDECGKHLSTREIHDWCCDKGYQVQFVIGGADGLPTGLAEKADLKLALGKMTWPHQLARVLLVEQLYRIESLRQGHPYHRD